MSENALRVLGSSAGEVVSTRDFILDRTHPEDRSWYEASMRG
jgi:hypothetical protein